MHYTFIHHLDTTLWRMESLSAEKMEDEEVITGEDKNERD